MMLSTRAAAVTIVAGAGATAGTAIINQAGGSIDPHPFTAAMTILGIVAGIYFLRTGQAEKEGSWLLNEDA